MLIHEVIEGNVNAGMDERWWQDMREAAIERNKDLIDALYFCFFIHSLVQQLIVMRWQARNDSKNKDC